MRKLTVLLFSLLISFAIASAVSAHGSPFCNGRTCHGHPPHCIDPCERNYTLFSFYKRFLYGDTFQPIIVHTSVEPAEFLDLHNDPNLRFPLS